jgi:hypothetical protein
LQNYRHTTQTRVFVEQPSRLPCRWLFMSSTRPRRVIPTE